MDYYRLPVESLDSISAAFDGASGANGYFQFGVNNICYGRSASGTSPDVAGSSRFQAVANFRAQDPVIHLPFDFNEVIENLRLEQYGKKRARGLDQFAANETIRMLYYFVRKSLPFSLRRQLQRIYFRDWKDLQFPAWPVDFTVDSLHEELLKLMMMASGVEKIPFIWFWPDGASSALILTHDVETEAGRNFTFKLMDLDDSYGFKASYQVIPEKRYAVPEEYVQEIRRRGCEFNIHDLNHDGHLYRERIEFERRAAEINRYVHRYQAQGFRAGAMYRKQAWYDVFEFSYDMSVPNVAHLEPVRGGCCTVMPYFIGKIVELPLTTTQDYSLFHILNEYSIELWQRELKLLHGRNGLMSLLTHPDYLIGRRERKVYESLLDYLRQLIAREGLWAALPGDVDRWWRARATMKLVPREGGWEITGPESTRARLAYAVLEGERIVYQLPNESRVDRATPQITLPA